MVWTVTSTYFTCSETTVNPSRGTLRIKTKGESVYSFHIIHAGQRAKKGVFGI